MVKPISIQHYVKENFEHYYIIDLEDKIGKKFSNKFSNDIQNSKDFSPDLHKTVIHMGYTPVFSFITVMKERWKTVKFSTDNKELTV